MEDVEVLGKDQAPSASTGARMGILSRIRMPLRAKITLPYLFLATALAISAGLVLTRVVFDTVDERFNNQLIEAGKLTSEWMVTEEDRLLETLRLLSHAEGVADAIREGDAEKLRDLSFGIVVNYQEDAVEFLDEEGKPLLIMRHRQGGGVEDYTFSTGGQGDYLRWGFVERVYEERVDQLGDKYSGFVRADWGKFFYVSGPIYDESGEFVGAVLVGKSLPLLVSQIQERTRIQVTLYDFMGTALATTFFESPILDPIEVRSVLSEQDEGSMRRDLENQRDLTVSNINYSEILGPWEVRGDLDLGVIGVSLPKTFLVNTSMVTRVQISILVIISLLLVILVGTGLATFITRPLLGLVDASTRVAQGDLQVQVEVNSNDEIAVLSHAFNQMVRSLYHSKADLIEAYDSALEGWSKAMELRDKETEGHTLRVTEMTVLLAREYGICDEELANVRRGAMLHDIGKMGIPDSILLKEGPLTATERMIMERHSQYAYDILKDIEFLKPALDIPLYHHERWDGKGYPQGLEGEQIPIAARIFAVVDVWDALRSDRPYRARMPDDEVLQHIHDNNGSHFDPQIVEIFLRILEEQEASKREQITQ